MLLLVSICYNDGSSAVNYTTISTGEGGHSVIRFENCNNIVVKTRVQRACTRDLCDWYLLDFNGRYRSSGHLTLPFPVLNYEAMNPVMKLRLLLCGPSYTER